MSYTAYLLNNMRAIVDKGALSYHTPGHKNGCLLPEDLKALWGTDFARYDLTELDGLDNLHFPAGAIADSQKQAARIWQCKQVFYLVNGTSVGLQAAIMASCRHQQVFVPRHAHRSIYHSLILAQAQPIYLPITIDEDTGLPLGVAPEVLTEYMIRYPKCRRLIMVHPTYQGITWRNAEVLALAKDNHLLVIVDEAHGSHLHFHQSLPPSLADLGADLVVQSWHKTLPVLTQGSALLVGKNYQGEALEPFLSLLQTTSPSYLTLASLEAASIYLAKQGNALLTESLAAYEKFFASLNKLHTLFRLWHEDWHQDKLKLYLLSDRLSGPQLAKALQEGEAIYSEMSDANGCLLILPLVASCAGLKRLGEALKKIDQASLALPLRKNGQTFYAQTLPEQVIPLAEAFYQPKRQILWETAAGCIAGEFIIKYPPGIPICVPGERITHKLVDQWLSDSSAQSMVTILSEE